MRLSLQRAYQNDFWIIDRHIVDVHCLNVEVDTNGFSRDILGGSEAEVQDEVDEMRCILGRLVTRHVKPI